MNLRRKIAITLGLCMAYSAFGFEWTWGINKPILLSASSRLIVLPAALIVGIRLGAFRVFLRDTTLAKTAILLIVSFFTVFLLERIHVSEYDVSMRFDFYISLIQSLVLFIVGYSLGRDCMNVLWILNGLAMILAIIGVYAFLAGDVEAGMVFPVVGVGFPVALFVVFGYCWYLHAWLSSSGLAIRPLIGLIACSLYVILNFHKPIIFMEISGTLFLLIQSLVIRKQRSVFLIRASSLFGLCMAAFFILNTLSHNQIAEAMEKKFLNSFLHIPLDSFEQVQFDTAHTGDIVEQASGRRFEMWKEAVGKFYASPWLGSGFGQTTSILSSSEVPVQYHNGYLDLLLSVGVLGCIPVLIGIILWFRTVLSRKAILYTDGMVIPVVAYMVSLMAYNLGGVSRVFSTIIAFSMFLAGLVVGWIRQREYKRLC